MRKCAICQENKEINEFRIDARRGKPRTNCKACDTSRHREWVEKNRDKVRASDRLRWQSKDRWEAHILRNYGLSASDYERMLVDQQGKCAICKTDKPGGSAKRFNIDHCHKSGAVRGLLCNSCNTALGKMSDNPEVLISAVIYLLGAPQAQAFIEAVMQTD